MGNVAQRLERWIVDPRVEGSNPFIPPTHGCFLGTVNLFLFCCFLARLYLLISGNSPPAGGQAG